MADKIAEIKATETIKKLNEIEFHIKTLIKTIETLESHGITIKCVTAVNLLLNPSAKG